LLKHLCDLIEELLDVLAGLGGDAEVGHFIFLDEVFQSFLFEGSKWGRVHFSRSVLLPQMMEMARSFLF